MAITPVATSIPQPPPSSTQASGSSTGFGDTLNRFMDRLEASSGASNDAIGRMLDGSGDVHDAMIALQRADLDLQLAVQVRNKLVQAYQEIMRMPV